MKKLYIQLIKTFFYTLLLVALSQSANAQDVTYSQTFANGTSYCPGQSQYDQWKVFRLQLDTNIKKFIKVQVFGSNNPNGVTMTDPTKVRQLAAALRNGTAITITDGSNTWQTDNAGACSAGGCGVISDAVELAVNNGGTCACGSQYSFRPCIANSNWGGISGSTCGGNTQTMSVTFFNPTGNNAGIGGVVSPTTSCGAVSDPFTVTLLNAGINNISNVPLTASITGTLAGAPYSNTYSATYSGTLTPQTSTNINLGTLNTASGADLKITVIVNYPGDTTKNNDTLITRYIAAGTPTANPSPVNNDRCGSGSVTLTANAPSGHTAYWYTAASGGSLLGVGNTFNTPNIPSATSRTFYVASAKSAPNRVFTTGFAGSSFAGNGFTGGTMFDMTIARSLTIDSLDVHLNGSAAQSVFIYVKSGSYAGAQTNKSLWSFVGKYDVVAQGLGRATRVKINPLELAAGTYGVYIYATDQMVFQTSSLAKTDTTISFAGGIAMRDSFATQITGNFFHNGTMYYRISCVSGTRIAVTATAKALPVGSDLTKGSLFNGAYNGGSIFSPDVVAYPDTIVYSVGVPFSYSQSVYGSAWNVVSSSVTTINGTSVASSNYNYTNGNTSTASTMRIAPGSSLTDSTLKVTVTLRRTDTGCDSVLTRIIYVAPRPVGGYNATSVCVGDVTEFTNTSTILKGQLSYLWDFGDGTTSTLTDPIKKYNTSGAYTVKMYVTSGFGYTDSSIQTVTVKAIPVANFKFVNACEGTAVSFTDNSTLPSGTPNFSWNFGDASTGTGSSTTHLYAQPNIYQTKLTVTVNGCTGSITKYVTQAPRGTVGFSVNVGQCDNKNVLFTNSSTDPEFGTVSYTWKFGDGNSATSMNASHVYNTFNTYNATLVAKTELGCVDSTSKPVTMKESPNPSFTQSGGVCSNEDVIFTNTSSVPSSSSNTYSWMFGDGLTATDASPVHRYSAGGSYTVTLKASSTNGCEKSMDFSVTIGEKPDADFVADMVCLGNETHFQNNSGINNGTLSYNWNLDPGTSTNDNPSTTYASAGTHNVTLIATAGSCSDTITKAVTVSSVPAPSILFVSNHTGDGQVKFSTTASGTGLSYLWEFGDGGSSTQQNPTYKYLAGAVWHVKLTITSAEGCTSTTDTSVAAFATGIADVAESAKLLVYPNPSTGNFKVSCGEAIQAVSVVNILGETVLSSKYESPATEVSIDLTANNAGIYFISVTTEAGNTMVKKVNVVK